MILQIFDFVNSFPYKFQLFPSTIFFQHFYCALLLLFSMIFFISSLFCDLYYVFNRRLTFIMMHSYLMHLEIIFPFKQSYHCDRQSQISQSPNQYHCRPLNTPSRATLVTSVCGDPSVSFLFWPYTFCFLWSKSNSNILRFWGKFLLHLFFIWLFLQRLLSY